VVTRASGRSRLGCLAALLLATAGLYFGINVVEIYWKHYRYRDAMQNEARFAHLRGDQTIAERLAAVAESLGLPEEARQVQIQRDASARRISIRAEYSRLVELPGWVRSFHFAPHVEATY
jgi:hypothetical protein